MINKVLLPKLGETMEEGAIEKWRVKEGAKVNKGDILFEITTDKANFEYEALKGGFIRKIIHKAGITVPVLTPVAYIADTMDEALPKEAPPIPVKKQEEPEAKKAPEPTVPPVSRDTFSAPTVSDGRIFATPVAKKLAKEMDIDLFMIKGSGPNGRIVEKDVLSYRRTEHKKAAPESYLAGLSSSGGSKTIELTPMRKIIGERLKKSYSEAPHFYVMVDIDMTETMKIRESLKTKGLFISPNDFTIFASAVALRKHPLVNSHFVNEKILQFEDANIGMAVAIDNGLVVPVIKQSNNKTLSEIAVKTKELALKAQAGKLSPEDFAGGTFTISNMGMLGVDAFTAIINPPQVAILAVSAVKKHPVIIHDALAIRPIMRVSLSSDHRVVDGAYAAGFLATLKETMEKAHYIL
ncbi:MAG: dihydrolipoamide acetyltransferase family protein [Candidatus Firestonebacteria bacterium]